MSSIIYRTDPKTGYVYAYESFSYRDPETKRPRTKQTYLGRVDPVTNEILPKGENGKRNRSNSSTQINELQKQITVTQQEVKQANEVIKTLQGRLGKADKFFYELKDMISRYEGKADPSNPVESSDQGSK